MNLTKIMTVLDVYVQQGRVMRNHGKFAGKEAGVCILLNWAGISAAFMSWALFAQLVREGALYIQRMSDAASKEGEVWYHLRPNKKALKLALHKYQNEIEFVKVADCTSKDWKAQHEQWIIQQTGELSKRTRSWYNLGWYCEFRVRQHFGLDWQMNRNRRTKGVADMVLSGAHWEIKDMVGAGFQIRPERAHELGLDELCAD